MPSAVTFAPYASASRTPWAPGERRQQRGVRVDDPTAEPAQERGAEQLHEAGEHERGPAGRPRPSRRSPRPTPPGRRSPWSETTAVGMPASAAMSSARIPPAVRDDGHHPSPVGGVDVRREQRGEVRPRARDHDDEPTGVAGGSGDGCGLTRRPYRAVRARECRGEQSVRAPQDRPRQPDGTPVDRARAGSAVRSSSVPRTRRSARTHRRAPRAPPAGPRPRRIPTERRARARSLARVRAPRPRGPCSSA